MCIDILHFEPAQLSIKLVSPDETEVLISQNQGNIGCPNFENVCFDMDAVYTVVGAVDCFSNVDLVPQGNLGDFNNGSISEYLWYLCIQDNDSFK